MDYGLIGTVAVCVVIAVIGILAVKFSVTYKVNWADRQKVKDEKMRLKIKSNCPHALIEHFDKNTGRIQLRSTFSKPFGVFYATCEMCGHRISDLSYPEQNLERWTKDIDGLLAKLKEHQKLGKKYLG